VDHLVGDVAIGIEEVFADFRDGCLYDFMVPVSS